MKLTARQDQIVLKRIDPDENRRPSGLLLPKTAESDLVLAKVVSVGEGRPVTTQLDGIPTFDSEPMPCKVGETVLVSKHAGPTFDPGDGEVMLVRASAIFCVVEDG